MLGWEGADADKVMAWGRRSGAASKLFVALEDCRRLVLISFIRSVIS